MNPSEQVPQDNEGMGPHESVSFVYYDDEDKVIPPEAEASVLMAVEAEAVDGQEGNLKQYHEDTESFEAKRMAALAWLEGYTSTSSAEALAAPSPDDMPTKEEDEEFEEDYDADQSEEGMPYEFSREATADDEQWVLERILRRRVDKTHPNRQHQYLCKWKYFVEPTWEGRELLEDEGFLSEVNDFDGVKAEQTGGVQRNRGSRPGQPQGNSCKVENRSSLESIFGNDLMGDVCTKFKEVCIHPLYVMSVAAPTRVKSFIEKWKSLSETHRPTILFHGTQSKNIIPIVNNGLIVPGQNGVKVANGSAYGVGIYTAIKPGVSAGYCDNRNPSGQHASPFSGEMFVCIGLVSNSDKQINVACGGSYIVYYDASYVVPLWLVGFKRPDIVNVSVDRVPRRSFNACFAEGPMLAVTASAPRNKWDAKSQELAAVAGHKVPADYRGKPMTKRMLREAPRKIKDLYKVGALIPLKGDGQK